MRRRNHAHEEPRRGKVLVLVAISLSVVLGAAAFALDGGSLLAERRHAQATADAAALAGAVQLYKSYPTGKGSDGDGTAKAAAFAVAASNGYSNDGSESIVTVNIPPSSGLFAGQAGYVEVIAQFNQPRGFSAIWGSDPLPVSARAVARGIWEPPGYGILTLHPTASPSTDSTGNGVVSVLNSGVIVNSIGGGALRTTGNGSMTAENFDVYGGYSGSGFSTTPNTQVPPTPDPLRHLPELKKSDVSAGTLTETPKRSRNYVATPGWYPRNGNPKLQFSNGDTVTFLPGNYYLEGGLTSTNATITGTNVMFFNAGTGSSDKINITGGTVTLDPPDTGIYKGITFFQARNATQDMQITGSGTTNIKGTFYAPVAELKIVGSSGTANIGSQYISSKLNLSGNGNINITYDPDDVANERLIGFVE